MHQNQKDGETALGLLRSLQLYDARGAENGVLATDVSLVTAALRLARQEGRAEKEAEVYPRATCRPKCIWAPGHAGDCVVDEARGTPDDCCAKARNGLPCNCADR